MTTDNRRYYLGEGPNTEAMLAAILARREEWFERRRALMHDYGADTLFIHRDMTVSALGFVDNTPRAGIRFGAHHDGYYMGFPDRRLKRGKELAQAMHAASLRKTASDTIIYHFNAARHCVVNDPNSRTGMAMAVSVATIVKGDWKRCLLSVPDDKDDPFTPGEELREIEHHEFVRLMEKGE